MNSYYFDTSDPDSEVVLFDSFALQKDAEDPDPLVPFQDVDQKDWFYGAVQHAEETGLMEGVGEDTFAPDGTTTRAQLVTILHRLEGQPAAGEAAFSDVPAGQWYTEAVAWATPTASSTACLTPPLPPTTRSPGSRWRPSSTVTPSTKGMT